MFRPLVARFSCGPVPTGFSVSLDCVSLSLSFELRECVLRVSVSPSFRLFGSNPGWLPDLRILTCWAPFRVRLLSFETRLLLFFEDCLESCLCVC